MFRYYFLIVLITAIKFITVITCTNNRPTIGILSQELEEPNKASSYIAASYVKAVESSGAQVVPIFIDRDEAYYRNIVKWVNGILFPGGSVLLNNTVGYAKASKIIYKLAIEMNRNRDYFPLMGVCLGFEALLYHSSDNTDLLVSCNSMNLQLNLNFLPRFADSRLFSNISHSNLITLKHENVTINFHSLCVTPGKFNHLNMSNSWRYMTYNYDSNGLKFISSVEHLKYPFFGVQFHPEKIAYEWGKKYHFSRSYDAITANRYFYDFFVNDCKRNNHTFPSDTEEKKTLIYNWNAIYTGINNNSSFTQQYFF